ncbi:MAG: transcriptional regulator [Alphaproteobacteria bacterium]|jgi:probable addiction module antidote protein|nr:transcriptional regulator [Thalassospira sp.]MCE2964635.1 transcriptional regulator [Alphaproteobacteria bacterium]
MTTTSIPFQDTLLESLKDPAHAQTYLDVALEDYAQDGDWPFFLTALRNVAEANGGLGVLAEKSNLNRQNLYKALSTTGNPKLGTLGAILRPLGLRLSVQPL